MPRSRKENQRIKEERKGDLLSAALYLLSEKGYKKTSMNEIAEVAKASHGLIYHYFKDKTELMEEIGKYSKTIRKMDIVAAQRAGSIDGISLIASFYREEDLTQNEIRFALFQLSRDFYEKEKDVDRAIGPSPLKLFATLLEQAAHEELVPYGDYKDKAAVCFDFFRGFLIRYLKSNEKQKPIFSQSAFNKIINS